MKPRRHPHLVCVLVFALATVASLGPHILMLGYAVTSAKPPSALLFVCPLHRLDAGPAPQLVLKAKPLT